MREQTGSADQKDVAALFVETRGIYYYLAGVDPYDVVRDARKYDGSIPVLAHPPCERWSRSATVHMDKPGKAIGNDEGCFISALSSVRKYGGVLEHPAYSYAWKWFFLRTPVFGEWTYSPEDGSYVTCVNQSDYGHVMTKPTWLYYVGTNPPKPLSWTGSTGINLSATSSKDPRRFQSPVMFACELVELARNCGGINKRK